jgi:hypothetical protein
MRIRSRKMMILGLNFDRAHKGDNLTAIREPTVWTTWDSQHLTILQASMACYGDNFNFYMGLVGLFRGWISFFICG